MSGVISAIKKSRASSSASRRERLTEAFDELKSAVEQITTGDDWRNYLDFQSRFHSYSARNTMWLRQQAKQRGMSLEMVAGFHAWRKAGRSVVSGAEGFKVLAPVVYRPEPEEEEEEQEESPKQAKPRFCGFRLVTVFDVSQTTGPEHSLPPNPIRSKPIVGECEIETINAIEAEIAKTGYDLEIVDAAQLGWPETQLGATTVAKDGVGLNEHVVRIRSDMSPAAKAKTMMHELAHIAMEHDNSNTTSETEAESVAYLAMQHLGIDSGSYSFGYVSGWAGDVAVVQRSAEKIRKTALDLIERLDKNLEVGDVEVVGAKADVPATRICNFPISKTKRCRQPVAGDKPNCGRHGTNLSTEQLGQNPTVYWKDGERHVWAGEPNDVYCLIHGDPSYQALCQLAGEKVPCCLKKTLVWRDEQGYRHRDDGPAEIEPDGTQTWRQHDELHRDDGPAVIRLDGKRAWYQHGELHRDDGPAVIWASGTQEWWQHGELHRGDDNPAVIESGGTQRWYRRNERHREDGPAVIEPNGTQEWYLNDEIHREDGPAVIYPDGTQEWWWHGEIVSQEEHANLSIEEFEEEDYDEDL